VSRDEKVCRMGKEMLQVRSHSNMERHVPSLGHPEAPARLRAVLSALAGNGGDWELDRRAGPAPEDDTLGVAGWLHEAGLIERIREGVARAPSRVDGPDNPVSAGSWDAIITAAGLAVQAGLDLINGRLTRAFLAVRPPGHHALPDQAMGFCFLNNAALAAEIIARAWQAPVLIADFDVHHGNGTQAIFWERDDVGFLSVHRYPFYPGTGAGDEVGEGRGRGFTRNVPLAAGADDAIYASAFEAGLEELGTRLRPAAIVVSAGFDAHEADPLGGMKVTEAGFERMSRAVVQAAETWSGGRVLAFLEGGYNLDALGASARACCRALEIAPAAPE